MWFTHQEFPQIIKENWPSIPTYIHAVTEDLKEKLKEWNKDHFGNIFRKKRRVLHRLEGIQRCLNSSSSHSLLMLEKELQKELLDIMNQEEILWFQKSREQAIKLGDRNTTFFHISTVNRRRHSAIDVLKREDGTTCANKEEILEMFRRHFEDIFSNTSRPLNVEGFPPCPNISTVQQQRLLDDVTLKEVKQAFFSMKPFKAPSPDGFQAVFFQQFWPLVSSSLLHLVQNRLRNGTINTELCKTLIVLIPKVEHPELVSHFRPIALCSVAYKVITKVLVNRLRPLLNEVVSPQ